MNAHQKIMKPIYYPAMNPDTAKPLTISELSKARRIDAGKAPKTRKLILHANNEHPAIYREGHRLVAGKDTNADTAKLDGSGHPIPNPYYNPLLSALDKIEVYCQKQIVCKSNESILWANCKQIAVEAINNWEQT